MRISWLEAPVIRATRRVLIELGGWDELLQPGSRLPPAPAGVPDADWPHIAEHVARAERVSVVVREDGLAGARARFGGSPHAVEQATLIAAAVQAEELELELVESLLECEIDELITYGTFLSLLVDLAAGQPDRLLAAYQRFCDAAANLDSASAQWPERVEGIRDGLANAYVICGRYDEADRLYQIRHREADGDLVVALAASRAFLSAGNVPRAVQWLGIGADRAAELGRDTMADRLRAKQSSLRGRLN